MRKFLHILLFSLLLLSCAREADVASAPEGYVTINFTVTGDQLPSTKALGEAANLQNLYVAVFGSSGYLKDYRPATFVSSGTTDYTFTNSENVEVTKQVPCFTYQVSIELSTTSRRIHFIGNGPSSIPFGRDYEVLPPLLGELETGFWQMITVTGIFAKQNEYGQYVNADGDPRQSGQAYVPSDETRAAFQNIPLIRNWAKIVVTSSANSNFTPYSFAVVNVPSQGTLVPYGGDKGFITDYKDKSFDELRGTGYNYEGNLPSSVAFDRTVPSEEDFHNYTNGVKKFVSNPSEDDPAHAVYLYERPVPNASLEPTYVILYGLYKNSEDTNLSEEERESGVECYYKVDLMAGGEYYPILRNFKYQIEIDKISTRGHATPAAAAAAAGSADVSADINASHLPDISDGTRRMAIQPWMSKTFIRAQAKSQQLYVVFYDDINLDHPLPNMDPASVTWELDPDYVGIIKDVEIGAAESDNTKENYGWRPISFAIASPEEAHGRTQTLRIKCKTNPDDSEESPLFREVVVTLLPLQPLRVSFSSDRVLQVKGEEQRVDVSIPDGLTEFIFPLVFSIEAEDMTLTPNTTIPGNNLPVVSESSIVDPNRQAFHFQRTLTWEDYKALESRLDLTDDTRWRTFSSYFTTNCDASATTVNVANEFFITGGASFTNYRSLKNSAFTTSIPRREGATVSVGTQFMRESDIGTMLWVDLQNMLPKSGSPLELDPVSGKYFYTPSTQSMTLDFVTTTADGDVSVTLSADDESFEPVVLQPLHFSSVGIFDAPRPTAVPTGTTYSNVAYGHVNSDKNSKQILLGYHVDANAPSPHPKVSLLDYEGAKPGSLEWVPVPVSGTFCEKWMSTIVTSEAIRIHPVKGTLSCVGYVEESYTSNRFTGNIATVNTGFGGDIVNKFRNKQSWSSKDQNHTFTITFSQVPSTSTDPAGIVLAAGQTYTIDVSLTPAVGQTAYLYYVGIMFADDGTNVYVPIDAEPVDTESQYFNYPGNDYEYGWSFPYGETSGTLWLRAPANRDIIISRIFVKSFRGSLLNENGI